MQQCVKLEIKKDSPCRSRSPDGAKFGHFTFVLQRTAKGWFTLATESEAESESEAQGALRSSVNQKSES